jgi:hypothetical protein
VEGRIEDRSTQGVVVMGIQVRRPDERRAVDSARVLTPRNGAAADKKAASRRYTPLTTDMASNPGENRQEFEGSDRSSVVESDQECFHELG